MLTINVDRDSVAMGDDVEGHAETWEMPDDATLGEVIVRAVDELYLASVAGRVAWTLEDSAGRLLAVIEIDGVSWPRRATVQSLWWAGLQRQISDDGKADDAGQYAFFFRYHSGGRSLAWDEFRIWVVPRRSERP